MSAHWQDVLDQQLDLYRHWRSPQGGRAGDVWARIMNESNRKHGLGDTVFRDGMIAAIESVGLLQAEPFYIDPEMMPLVRAAELTFQPEPLRPQDLLAPAGFILLPEPLSMPDVFNKRISFRGILWTPAELGTSGRRGIVISWYTHADDADGSGEYDDYTMPPEMLARVRAEIGSPLILAHIALWAFDDTPPDATVEPDVKVFGGFWRPTQALFRLMQQTIADRYEHAPPRAVRRRWARERPQHEPYVTVIRLRRPRHTNDDHEPGSVEWSHRWLVGGHWRNQWFPSEKTHRQVWISPYIKGPEDKPLVLRARRAFELVR